VSRVDAWRANKRPDLGRDVGCIGVHQDSWEAAITVIIYQRRRTVF
jgi:hypothetical protein